MEFSVKEENLVPRRRHLHMHPELSFQEKETQEYILKELKNMGIEGKKIASTGVICRLGPSSGPAIALRADTDALPVLESNEVEYKSKNEGKMHACGHDGHVSGLLATLETIKDWKLTKGVVGLFQPAEEGYHGARKMVEEGCMEDVEAVFGIHLWNTLAYGKIGISEGPVMANSDRFTIEITGRGGHGSMPHDCADPTLAAANVVLNAQQIVARNLNPMKESAVISFGGIKTNSFVSNVIPESVSLCGTVRSYEEPVRCLVEKRLGEICQGVELLNGLKADYKFVRGYSAVVNDAIGVKMATQAGQKVDIAEVVPAPKVLSGEDFYYYNQEGKVPSCFIFVGSAINDGVIRPHHSPEFDIDERALLVSAKLYCQIVYDNCR
uniref:Peptidase M20 dimerisation domain-containing protein n=1 Tax=Paramoeba aestuarina TaxID=180227 RepID=A0A7S4L9F0_9EUKA|mmetsp:Transcript_33265/g.52002  ORF Transcript_33265/g.52002 Transcript_33265/m.52002 type:complete len:382 (+) Transcript_33265:123-1268(+)